MGDMAEDRVYDAEGEGTPVFVAADVGVVRVETSAGRVGGFGVAERCAPRDVAAGGGVAVATDEDVLFGHGEGFEGTDFGPARAVGFRGGDLLAADGGGCVSAREGNAWRDVGSVETAVRAIDGDLIGTADGVFRIDGDRGLASLGLADVRDVDATGAPLAATADGLHEWGDGWKRVYDGDVRAVAAGSDGVAHAATAEAFVERRDGEWAPVDLPTGEQVVDIDHGPIAYAVTTDGTLLTGDGEWRAHPIGVRNVVGLAVA